MLLYIFFIIIFILLGTKFINFYYNFFHIYKYLDNDQKIMYFKNNFLINYIIKNQKLKIILSMYILTPLIKINYLIISTLICLLYSLCEKKLNISLNNDNAKEINYNINSTYTSSINDKSLNLKNDIDIFMSEINVDNDSILISDHIINKNDSNNNLDIIKSINIDKFDKLIKNINKHDLSISEKNKEIISENKIKKILENIVENIELNDNLLIIENKIINKVTNNKLNANELNLDELNPNELNPNELNLNLDELNPNELNLNLDELNPNELNLNLDELNLNPDELNANKITNNENNNTIENNLLEYIINLPEKYIITNNNLDDKVYNNLLNKIDDKIDGKIYDKIDDNNDGKIDDNLDDYLFNSKINNLYTINNEDNIYIDTLTIDEINFGDYMSSLIENDNIQTNNKNKQKIQPSKIKIGKKKIQNQQS